MFNSQSPRTEDLPTSRQLLGASAFAAGAAAVILVTIVLPSEYAIDPTGIGRALSLTQMGEIKIQLAQEAALAEAAETAAAGSSNAVVAAAPTASATILSEAASTAGVPADATKRTDTTRLTLAPGQGAEIKLVASKGARISYNWAVEGGRVNYDVHADAPGISYHGYGKGRDSAGEQGDLVAAFDGSHGWFWRNRSASPVTITLQTDGAYTEVKRVV